MQEGLVLITALLAALGSWDVVRVHYPGGDPALQVCLENILHT